MKELKLNKGYIALVDDEDYEELSKYKWNVIINKKTGNIYAARREMMHEHILDNIPNRNIPVDHIDGNGLNNQKDNLRIVSKKINRVNSKKNRFRNGKPCTSIYRGVCWDKRSEKWLAQLHTEGKNYKLGRFENEIDAAKAYNIAATKYFGQYATLNTIA